MPRLAQFVKRMEDLSAFPVSGLLCETPRDTKFTASTYTVPAVIITTEFFFFNLKPAKVNFFMFEEPFFEKQHL